MGPAVVKIVSSLLVFWLLLFGQTHADNLPLQNDPLAKRRVAVSFGAYYWRQNYSGNFKISEFDIRPVDVESDLAIKRDNNLVYFLELSHQLPYVPQLKLQKTAISSAQNTTISLGKFFSLDQITFRDLRAIRSEMDFDHIDVDLFYRVFSSSDNKRLLNVGVTLRQFDGYTFVTETQPSLFSIPAYRLDFDDKVPLLYLNGAIDIGLSNLIVNATLHYGNYKKNEMTDFDINLGYRLPMNVLLYLGYRQAVLDLGDFSGLVADITTDGIYSGFSFSF